MRLRERLVFKGPSEQDYGHSAGVCRALLLGVVRREWPHPWQVRQRRGGARQAPPKGAYSQSGHICVQSVLKTGIVGSGRNPDRSVGELNQYTCRDRRTDDTCDIRAHGVHEKKIIGIGFHAYLVGDSSCHGYSRNAGRTYQGVDFLGRE